MVRIIGNKGRDFPQASSEQIKISSHSLQFFSSKAPEFIDITDQVLELIKECQINMGLAVIYSMHTTAAIKINENEPLLLSDMEIFLDRLSPKSAEYSHNDFTQRTVNMTEDECPNGHSHCQHLILSTSETVPIVLGKPQLGQWQRIFLVELDRPRPREVLVQVLGI